MFTDTNLQISKRQSIAVCLLMILTVPLLAQADSLVLAVENSRLVPCPASPNCVSSLAVEDRSHAVEPFTVVDNTWQLLRTAVLSLPRTKIVAEDSGYLHAESRSALFGFVDHLELEIDKEKGIINVRSASVTGYGDFGVNRRRVEKLRQFLADDVSTKGAIN